MNELDVFFKEIKDLREKHKDKGEFNAFHSIGFSSQETMHSKFISVLLDPKAQHGQKSQFLNLFIKHAKLDFVIDNVAIKTEKSAKKRRMDITIENKTNNSILVIENKIWAQDQTLQLADYYKFCMDNYEKVCMIYLTPYGNLPAPESLGEISQSDVKCISYEKAIIPWIEECIVETNGRLKASLEMYREILHKLINRDKYMNKIFEELKKDKEKLKLAIDINSTLQGRNYIKEFPESIGTFIQCLYETGENVNPYPDPFPGESIDNRLTIADDTELNGWDIVFDENVVFAHNRTNDEIFSILNPKDINDKRLQSLIFEEKESINEWLFDILREMKSKA